MNYFFVLLIFFILTFTSCTRFSPDELLVMKVTNIYELKENKNHNLILVGRGSAIPDKIHAFILSFFSYQRLDQNQVRRLVVDLAEDLITLVKQNAEIQEYLANLPFNVNNYELTIIFKDSNNKNQEFPYVTSVALEQGKISYFYYDNSKGRYLFDKTNSESYQEALRIVREEK